MLLQSEYFSLFKFYYHNETNKGRTEGNKNLAFNIRKYVRPPTVITGAARLATTPFTLPSNPPSLPGSNTAFKTANNFCIRVKHVLATVIIALITHNVSYLGYIDLQ